MAIFFDAPVAPSDLTTFVRKVPFPEGNTLLSLFPQVFKPENTIELAEITKKNRTAKFRSFDGNIYVADRDTALTKRLSLAPISAQRSQGEYERLQMEMSRMQGTNKALLVDAIYNEAEDLTGYIWNRLELAMGSLLSTGKMTINENGLKTEADYGLGAGSFPTAGTLWSVSATADPLQDMLTWADAYANLNGGSRPGRVITSTAVVRALMKSAKMINAVRGSAVGVTMVSLPEMDAALMSYGLPTSDKWTIYDTQLSVDNVDTRVIAQNKFVFLPDNPANLAQFRFGTSATAMELLNAPGTSSSFSAGPGIVGVVIKEGPPFRQYTYVDSVALPILTDATRLMTATVL